MAGKIRVGIAGCGMIARRSHIQGFNSISGVEVAALYDNVRKQAEDCRRRAAPKAEVFSRLYEFLPFD